MPRTNKTVLIKLMREKDLMNSTLADMAGVSERTVNNARAGQKLSEDSIEFLAGALEVPERMIIHPDDLPKDDFPRVRDVSGNWCGTASDVRHDTHFPYQIDPLVYEIEVELEQSRDGKVKGTVTSNGIEFLTLEGEVRESGNFVVAYYHSMNPEVHDYGFAMIEFKSCGQQVGGYFLGREHGHGTTFVLASIDLQRSLPKQIQMSHDESISVEINSL